MLDRLIKRTVEKHLTEHLNQHIDAAIRLAMKRNPRFQFVKAMQMQMLGCDPKMDPREAWNAAVNALNSFCEEEGCEFGDDRFDWSRDGAVALIHEYEIHHWESAA